MLFGVSITTTKISILCLCHRLFPTPLFRRATVLLGVVCVVWWIVIEVILIAKCTPMAAFLDAQVQAHPCINFESYFLAANITETILDFATLCLPLRAVASLQIPPRQKTILYMTFLVGGL